MNIINQLFGSTERIINGDVQISLIPRVRSASELPFDNLIRLELIRLIMSSYTYNNRLFDIKDRLFPMGIFRMGTGAKSNRFMTSPKTNIEPSHESMNKIVSGGSKSKIGNESKIGNFARIKIKIKDSIGIRSDTFQFDCVHQRLFHCNRGNRRKIKTVNRLPVTDFLLFVVCVFDTGDK
jgi:hypothetical protein